MKICDNEMCQYNKEMPSSLSDDASVVRLAEGTGYGGFISKDIRRHLYTSQRNKWYKMYLCDACHNAIEMTK